MPVDPFEQLNTLFTDIADAIREKMPSKYDFTDMTVFNRVCSKETGITVDQGVFNALNSHVFEHPEWYPSFCLFHVNSIGSDSVYLYLFATSHTGETFDLSDIVVEQLPDRLRVYNNSNYGLRYGYGYGHGTVISTPNNIGEPPYVLVPKGTADLSNRVLSGNIFNDNIGSINAQEFSTLIRNLDI